MNSFINFVKSISLISLFIAAVWILVPKGKTEKTVKYAIGVFFIISVIASFQSNFYNLNISENKFINNSEIDYSESSADMQNGILENSIAVLLNKSGIKYEKIKAITDISDDYCISISKVELYTDDDENYNKASNLIKNETGIEIIRGN